MKAAPFEYVRPKSVAEASVALGRRGANTAAIAGGQSLLPMLNLRVALIDLLVDISRLDDLKTVTETPDSVWLGALTTHAAIEDGKTPDIFNGLMRRIAGQISYRAVRNHGTIGGSVALADPAADWPCCPDRARCHVADRRPQAACACERVADFIQDSYATTLTTGDIIMGFDIPAPKAPLRWGFAKVARKSGAFAHSIAIVAAQGKDGPVSAVLGAAGPRPLPLTATAHQLSLDRQLGRTGARARSPPTSTPISPGSTPIRSECTRRTSCARCGTCGPNDSDHRRIEWREDQRRRRAASDAGRFPARPLRADRDASRLRAWRLRRLHRGGGRDRDALVPDARRHVRRPLGPDAGRAARRSGDGAAAPAFPREPRPAMRLLHAGHADHGARHPAAARAAGCTRPSATS